MTTPTEASTEPAKGSVVLGEGPTGTAWQRFYSDGLWHSTTGKVRTWRQLVNAEQAWKRGGAPLLVHNTQGMTRPTRTHDRNPR